MPSIDQDAKRWQMEFAARVGTAIRDRRKRLGLTAQQLAAMTEDHGYPITRVAISKIESNSRSGKLDIAELVVLAVALKIPPVLLLYPGYPDAAVDFLPNLEVPSSEAVDWVAGYMGAGTDLIRAVRERQQVELDAVVREVNIRSAGVPPEQVEMQARILELLQARVAELPAEIDRAKSDLWGDDV